MPAAPPGPTGTIEGTVYLEGPVRRTQQITISSPTLNTPACRDAARRYEFPFDVTQPGPFPGALVAVEALESAPPPTRELRLTFRECDIVPRVLFATTRDRIMLHLEASRPQLPHVIGAGTVIDQLLIPGQPDREQHFPGPGRYPVQVRGLPDWVQSLVFVLPNRFIDQTDTAGHFRITNVPVGNRMVHAWYPGAIEARRIVTVREGETTRVDFQLRQAPPPALPSDAGPASPGEVPP